MSAIRDSTAASANRSGACSRNGSACGPVTGRGCGPSGLGFTAARASSGTDRSQRSWRARPAGSCRSTTCTLLPPMPVVDTAARRDAGFPVPRSLRQHKPGVAAGDQLVRPVHAGGGGTTPVPSASTVLISPAAPAAALACPMFALTEPSAAGPPRPGPDRVQGGELCLIVERRASPVPLNELNVGWVDAAALIRSLHRQQLAARLRLGLARHAAGRGAPAENLRIDGQSGGAGVGGAHQDDDAAALAGQVASRLLVVNPDVAWLPAGPPWPARSARAGPGSGRRRRRWPRRGRRTPGRRRRMRQPAATRSRRCRRRGCRRGTRSTC